MIGYQQICGKPMVGVVEILRGWRARMCQEHYELFVNPPPESTGLWLQAPREAGSLALQQLAEEMG